MKRENKPGPIRFFEYFDMHENLEIIFNVNIMHSHIGQYRTLLDNIYRNKSKLRYGYSDEKCG